VIPTLFVLLFFQVIGELPGVLIDRRLATDLGLAVGDTVRAAPGVDLEGATHFRVEGVFERAADPNRISRNEYEVRFHLPDLERMLPLGDRVDRFAVTLEPGADPERAGRWVEGLAFGTRVFETAKLAEETTATFKVISRFHDAIAFVTLLASGVFLLCLMVIRVDERRSDVRTLRLMGISGGTIVRSILLEAATIAILASLLGAALGVGISAVVDRYFGSLYDTTLRFAIATPAILGLTVALGTLLGVIAGGFAVLRVVRIPPQRLGER